MQSAHSSIRCLQARRRWRVGVMLLAAYLALYCGLLDWLPLQTRGFVSTELDVVSEYGELFHFLQVLLMADSASSLRQHIVVKTLCQDVQMDASFGHSSQ